ncbi:MAG: ribonuclease Z [Candidatus Paralactobacillus gallistercoris]|uniref:Ribonuclease Z n=1 Tax=Candidatus Paralactobacillus gallistercoris TaxID=2838724 RepID=A0A948TIG3_9LACO|nr:ribonuclease Z [Candidatus Paralactobacillus gallistercoris]
MELEFLGTGAGVPARNRNVASVALKLLDERNEIWLFDAGEGTQQQILRTAIKPRKITKIFITHLHGDHIFGLPGLLSSRSFQGGNSTLTIYGPRGIEEYVRTSLRISESHLTYKLKFVNLPQSGVIFEDKTFKVVTARVDHRIPAYGFRVVEKDHPGELLVAKLKAMDIPSGPIYGQLKAGKTVTLPDGRVLDGKDFVGPAQKGRIVTIIGDTRRTENCVRLAKNADVLVHESTFADDDRPMAHQYYHTTSAEAAEIAKQAHVKELLLTHISARYIGRGIAHLQKQARRIFANTKVVNDFDIVNVPFDKNNFKK